jgi:pseudouridylate synthase
MHAYLNIHPEVREALASNKPVVALESTIIAHGMPYPRNVETALKVEEAVRAEGAVPATIAILDGICRIGLNRDELEFLATAKNVWKVSTRDIAYVVSSGMAGATTVAATMRLAAMAGIRIFVTGGIGGVHRGAEDSMDVSADLVEMGRTSVAVVSAGVKSILDIGLTLEYLETLGVPVITFGQDEFPSFYSANSTHGSPLRLDDTTQIAAMLKAKWSMGLEGAVLIANPVPQADSIEAAAMEKVIEKALIAAAEQNIKGKNITPFLLQYIATHTKGESLEANIALVLNNARLGARIAVACCDNNPEHG